MCCGDLVDGGVCAVVTWWWRCVCCGDLVGGGMCAVVTLGGWRCGVCCGDPLPLGQVAELKAGGADVTVTRSNCIEYIHLLAHFKLNVQIHRQFVAFRSGLSKIIPLKWLQLFNQNELQVLISGAEGTISVEELEQYTHYAGMLPPPQASCPSYFPPQGNKLVITLASECSGM